MHKHGYATETQNRDDPGTCDRQTLRDNLNNWFVLWIPFDVAAKGTCELEEVI
jgi:hypothetical protein